MTRPNRDYVQADKKYLWHPFTPMKPWLASEPVVIERAEGFELIDAAGRRYVDGFSSLWCNLHGHRVPRIDQAIREQLDKVAHTTLLGLASIPSIELAERLVALAAPLRNEGGMAAVVCRHGELAGESLTRRQRQVGDLPPKTWRQTMAAMPPHALAKVFFSDSGAAAVEIALKMAFQFWQIVGQPRRQRFLALRESYHGDTLGAVSVGGIDLFHRAFRPLLFPATFVESPCPFYRGVGVAPGNANLLIGDDCAANQEIGVPGCDAGVSVLREIDAALSASPGEYAAVVVEPLIQAAAGMWTHPRGFLKGLRDLTRRHDVLLIADEVATGFCRTGTMFACGQEGVCPDLLCLGKGLTGGYLPVAATLAAQRIFDAFCEGDAGVSPAQADGGYGGTVFFHGHTFTGNALGCAAANASIDLIRDSRLLDALPDKIAFIARKLAPLQPHAHVGDIRQCGMMVGIDLVADRGTKTFFDPALRVGPAVCRRALDKGLMIRPLGDVVALMPAPAMDAATLERLLDGTVEAIHEHFRKS